MDRGELLRLCCLSAVSFPDTKEEEEKMRQLLFVAIFASFSASCTYRHLNEIRSPFPQGTRTFKECMVYSDFPEALTDMRAHERKGWSVTMLGDEETYYYIIVWVVMSPRLVICYEKPKAPPTQAPEIVVTSPAPNVEKTASAEQKSPDNPFSSGEESTIPPEKDSESLPNSSGE